MGKSHLLLGGAGFLGIGAPALAWFGVALSPSQLAAGTIVCAGAAMLPDMDHPQATVSRSLGRVSQFLAKYLAKLFGGHRNGTHSILFAVAVAIGLKALLETPGSWAAIAICFFFSSLVVKVLTETSGIISAILSAVIALTLVSINPDIEWIYLAVALGCLLHDLGDVLTPEGVPPAWPLSKRRLSIPIIGHTGDKRETMIGALCALAIVGLGWTNVYEPIFKQQGKIPKGLTGQTIPPSSEAKTLEARKLNQKLKIKRERLEKIERQLQTKQRQLSELAG